MWKKLVAAFLPPQRLVHEELVQPHWHHVSIYDGPEVFDAPLMAIPERARPLLATRWAWSEICNGGLLQFFFNSTGVVAPTAAAGFRQLGMPETANEIEAAMRLLGASYPRDRDERVERLEQFFPGVEDVRKWFAITPFEEADQRLFRLFDSEAGGYQAAAEAFAVATPH